MSANTSVVYPFPLPLLTIKQVPGGGRSNCYSETLYEVVSKFKLDAEKLKHLDACGLLGFGQDYSVIKEEEVEAPSAPITVDAAGNPTGEPPVTYKGEPITKPTIYVYYRYTVRRICDSGD